MEPRFIYRNRSSRRMRGRDQVIVYVNGVLCAMDRKAKVIIPVSRWKLAAIGVACFWAALRGDRGEKVSQRSLDSVPVREPEPEALPPVPEIPPEPSPEATRRETAEAQWERLMQELRDLSR